SALPDRRVIANPYSPEHWGKSESAQGFHRPKFPAGAPELCIAKALFLLGWRLISGAQRHGENSSRRAGRNPAGLGCGRGVWRLARGTPNAGRIAKTLTRDTIWQLT